MSFLPPLQQNAGVGFLLQNADHRTGGPLGVRHIRIAAGGVGQAPAVLVGHGGENAQPVQFLRDMLGAGPVNAAAVNVPHHTGGVFVNEKVVFILRVFPVAVDGAGAYIVPILPLGQQGAPGFHGNITGIGVVQQIFQCDMEIIAVLLVGRVNAVIDRDKPDAIGGKYLPEM